MKDKTNRPPNTKNFGHQNEILKDFLLWNKFICGWDAQQGAPHFQIWLQLSEWRKKYVGVQIYRKGVHVQGIKF